MTDTIQPTLDATNPAVTAAIQAETIADLQRQLADAQKIIDAATLGEGYKACIERDCDHFITDEAWNRGEYCPEVKTRPVTAAELLEAREALAETKAELAAREADWAAPSEAGNARRQLLAGLSAELVDVDHAAGLLALVKAALDRIRKGREDLEGFNADWKTIRAHLTHQRDKAIAERDERLTLEESSRLAQLVDEARADRDRAQEAATILATALNNLCARVTRDLDPDSDAIYGMAPTAQHRHLADLAAYASTQSEALDKPEVKALTFPSGGSDA